MGKKGVTRMTLPPDSFPMEWGTGNTGTVARPTLIIGEEPDGTTERLFTSLQSIASRGLSDTLLDRLVEMILDGTLPPGYEFPNENVICSNLNIGRSTLRETYKALMALGFITRSKRGTKVNKTRKIISSVPLNFIVRNSNLDDLDDFRKMLETETAYRAAKNASEEQVAEIKRVLDYMRENVSNIEALTKGDTSFHLAIANGSQNTMMINTVTAVLSEIETSAHMGYYTDTSTIGKSIYFHEQIYDAIHARDKERARTAMRSHIQDIYVTLRELAKKEDQK